MNSGFFGPTQLFPMTLGSLVGQDRLLYGKKTKTSRFLVLRFLKESWITREIAG